MANSKGNEAHAIKEQWTNGDKSGNQNRTERQNNRKRQWRGGQVRTDMTHLSEAAMMEPTSLYANLRL